MKQWRNAVGHIRSAGPRLCAVGWLYALAVNALVIPERIIKRLLRLTATHANVTFRDTFKRCLQNADNIAQRKSLRGLQNRFQNGISHWPLVEKPEGRRPLQRSRRRWKDNMEMNLREVGLGGGAYTGSIWLRIETGGGLLWIRWWTFGFHKIRGISWVG